MENPVVRFLCDKTITITHEQAGAIFVPFEDVVDIAPIVNQQQVQTSVKGKVYLL